MESLADLYLGIAQREFEQLQTCEVSVSWDSSNGYSDHFRHAVICSLFAAVAVEHAITELIWIRYTFPPIFGVGLGKKSPRELDKRPAMLDFLRNKTSVQDCLIDRIDELFRYRNKIAHAHPKDFHGNILDAEVVEELDTSHRGKELADAIDAFMERDDDSMIKALAGEVGKEQTSLTFDSLNSDDLEAAGKHRKIAHDALPALRKEWTHKLS